MFGNLFRVIYSFFEAIESGLPHQTKSTRAQFTVGFVSFFEMLNLMTIFKNEIRGEKIYFPAVSLIVLNSLIFLVNARYERIVSNRPTNYEVYKIVTIIYIITSLIFFALTR